MSQPASSVVSLDGDTSAQSVAPQPDACQNVPSVLHFNHPAPTAHQAYRQARSVPIVHELTQGLATDTTKPSTSSVKVSHMLDSDDFNLNPWPYNLINCGITKECMEAFHHSNHFTKANSAALHLLLSSILKEFAYHVARMSAYDALMWINGKFQGGRERSTNSEWFRRLAEEAMTREDTLEQCVLRKFSLYQNLLENHHPLHPDDCTKYVIDGLPPEFGPGKTSLYAPCAGGQCD